MIISAPGHVELVPSSLSNSRIAFEGRQLSLRTCSQRRRTSLNRPSTTVSASFQPVVCVTSVSEDGFDKAVLKEKEKVVLVDFWASWCGPCKLIDPFMKQLEEEFPNKLKVVKVEADPNPALVEKYKVYGLPTLILFKDGSMIKGSLNEGAITKPALLKYLEKYGVAKEVAK